MLKKIKKSVEKKLNGVCDWFEEDPTRWYYFGLGVGLMGGFGVGAAVGCVGQYKLDNKAFHEFLHMLDDGFKEMQPKYINMTEEITIDPVLCKSGETGLKITGYDIYGKEISHVIGANKITATSLANGMLDVANNKAWV